MTELPSMPLYVDDYEADTAHLTPEEDGIYNRLLRLCWRSPECMVPDDETWLRRKLRVDQACWERACRPVIEEFFTCKNGRIFQKRQREEFLYVLGVIRAKKAAGSKGGRAKARKAKEIDAGTAMDLPEANDKQNGAVALAPTPTPTPTIRKEEEGAHAREAGFAEEGQGADGPPADAPEPPPSTHPTIPPGLLDDVRAAVGIQSHDTGAYWADPSLAEHVAAWIGSGLAPDRIVAEAKASRAKNPEPPDGPRALDRWMAQAASAKASTALVKPAAKAKPATTPVSPEDRLNFFADWVNGDKLLPASVISPVMARALLESGKVTQERMRERGVR